MAAGRKRADLCMQRGGNRQRVWEALRKSPSGTSLYALARATETEDDTVLSYLRCLMAGGYVEQKGRTYAQATFVLLRDVGVEAPKLNRDGTPNNQGRGVEAMWRSLRILGELDASELAISANASGVPVSLNTAKSYLAWLHKAGYVHLVAKGVPCAAARYRLLPGKYSGPLPPMIQRIGQVFDPNLGEVVYRQQMEAEQ